jgi:hypothetical protein
VADERVRVEVAFDGGQVLSVLVAADAAEELERALGSSAGAGSFGLEAEDGRYVIALGKVVYVKRFTRESRVGFTPS